MLRRLFIFASTLSLLVCVVTAVLWWRSEHHAPEGEDRYWWLSSTGERFTARSDCGRITLFSPPKWDPQTRPLYGMRTDSDVRDVEEDPASFTKPDATWRKLRPAPRPPPQDPSLGDVIAKIRTDQLKWHAVYDSQRRVLMIVRPAPRLGTPASRLSGREYWLQLGSMEVREWDPPLFASTDLAPALLQALEDPERAVVAHLMLADITGAFYDDNWLPPYEDEEPIHRAGFTPLPDGSAESSFGSLRVRLPPLSAERIADGRSVSKGNGPSQYPYNDGAPPVVIDRTQFPALRDQWHRRLDVVAWSVPYWQPTAALATLPVALLLSTMVRAMIRRSRRRSNRCLNCGFDLRATPDRCPECGVERRP